MSTISQIAIKAEVIHLRQALDKHRPTTPKYIFVSSEEELEEAKRKYGEGLEGIIVYRWNIKTHN